MWVIIRAEENCSDTYSDFNIHQILPDSITSEVAQKLVDTLNYNPFKESDVEYYLEKAPVDLDTPVFIWRAIFNKDTGDCTTLYETTLDTPAPTQAACYVDAPTKEEALSKGKAAFANWDDLYNQLDRPFPKFPRRYVDQIWKGHSLMWAPKTVAKHPNFYENKQYKFIRHRATGRVLRLKPFSGYYEPVEVNEDLVPLSILQDNEAVKVI